MNDELIILLVEKCPHLYDRSLKEYKDKLLKENSWLSIAEHLQCDVEMVTKRWDNLRDRLISSIKAETPSTGEKRKFTPEVIVLEQEAEEVEMDLTSTLGTSNSFIERPEPT
ncbi:unnamed protein product [Brassicogethes aeneus]|uniref:MADF domain-containing protein n=1 Tax=Brassicogethes aeneus TaxID=1431903 RepID=A0A9P0BEW6_BRAAE|nr:unnamed protein product [Brassicogethes aeneus]